MRPMPANDSVNTFKQTHNSRSRVFYVVHAATTASMPMDWLVSNNVGTATGTHETIEETVFSLLCGPCRRVIRDAENR
jgi:hypothetical protein